MRTGACGHARIVLSRCVVRVCGSLCVALQFDVSALAHNLLTQLRHPIICSAHNWHKSCFIFSAHDANVPLKPGGGGEEPTPVCFSEEGGGGTKLQETVNLSWSSTVLDSPSIMFCWTSSHTVTHAHTVAHEHTHTHARARARARRTPSVPV